MSSIHEMQASLAEFDQEWEEAQEASTGGGGAILKAGDYQARVTISRVERDTSFDVLQFVTRFTDVVSGDSVMQWDNLDIPGEKGEIGRKIAAGRAKALGFTGKLSELPQACADGFFDDLLCDIRVKDQPARDNPDKVYKQVYVNRLHGRGESYTPSGRRVDGFPPAADDDDIPFAYTWA